MISSFFISILIYSYCNFSETCFLNFDNFLCISSIFTKFVPKMQWNILCKLTKFDWQLFTKSDVTGGLLFPKRNRRFPPPGNVGFQIWLQIQNQREKVSGGEAGVSVLERSKGIFSSKICKNRILTLSQIFKLSVTWVHFSPK